MQTAHSHEALSTSGGSLLATAWQDLRHGARLLRRSPGFAIIAVVTIGLGIGANSAIFSVVNSVVRKPLAYPAADRLMFLTSQFPTLGFDKFWVSPPEYFDFVDHTRAFSGVGAYSMSAVNLSGSDRPERVNVAAVTANMFTILGAHAQHGRVFTAEQDVPNADPVVVLSYELWQRTFGGDLALIGKRVQVNGVATTVLGVMPPGFDLHDAKAQLWVPLGLDPANRQNRGSHYLYLVGRLAPGATEGQATAELNGMLRSWREWAGNGHVPNDSTHRMQMAPLQDEVVGNVRRALWVLQGAVALVLLIACANVANLLLARAESRHKEFALRTALGAGRGRVLRQFIAEGTVVSLLGAALGLGVAYAGLKALLAANPDSIPRATEITLDPLVLLVTVAVAIGTGLVFGLAPLLHLGEASMTAALKEGGARTTANVGRSRMRSGLVVGEIALAVMLVIGAGLLIRTFRNLTTVDAGFDAEGRMTFGIVLPNAVYPDSQRASQTIVDLTRKLEAIPGVTRAAAMQGLPPVRQVNANDTDFEGYAPKPGDPPANVDYYQSATVGYLETMGIRLVNGRGFQATDAAGGPVVLVNQALVKRFFPNVNPLGRRIRPGFGPDTPWFTIVGVVADVKQGGLDAPAGTELYFSFEQLPRVLGYVPREMNLVLQSAQPLTALATSIRNAVSAIDPTLPIVQLRTMDEVIGDALVRQRFLSLLLGLFAGVALLLAAIGTYGILAYMVAERQQEIGIRLALGAGASQVVGLVLRQGATIVGIGMAVGVAGALAVARLTQSLLFGVSPFDPLTFVTVVGVIALSALAACLVPMRRAARVDVLAAVRGE
jgi:putative ABC transport system permease protein